MVLATITASAGSAEASIIRWTLDARLIEGGAVTGSFFFDTNTTAVSNVDLTSSMSSPSGGLTFDTFLGVSVFFVSGPVFGQKIADPDKPQVALELNGIRIDDLKTPGVLNLRREGFAEFDCLSKENCAKGAGSKITIWDRGSTLAGSEVDMTTPVPLPAAGWLLMTALGGLGLYGRMRLRT
jgi:hypothetical protein